ncbi:hypothetical protein [Clostridium sp. KNHs205]|uniref:hypothetical protein n=1 Tax=Clostridium sp. KNHs205 TaxID=1449050 RepID=UPI00051B244C|nr:hypothetical protein [Clostridium sp. KNHs205]
MNVFVAELRRVLTRGNIIFMMLLMVAGIILCFFSEQHRFTDDKGYTLFLPDSYKMLKSQVAKEPDIIAYYKSQLDHLKNNLINSDNNIKVSFTDSRYEEYRLFNYVYNEAESILNYKEYLSDIQKTANRLSEISIFSNSASFYNRNILKTAKDYEKLSDISPTVDENAGIISIMKSPQWDLLIFFGLFFLCIKLVVSEKAHFIIICSTVNGRKVLMQSKVHVAVIFCVIIISLQSVVQIIFSNYYYGLGDLTRPIQSVYITSPYKINVLQSLVIIYVVKLAIYTLITFIILLVCEYSKGQLEAILYTAVILAICLVLYNIISPFSALNFFKYINPLFFLQPSVYIATYINLNIFGYPVNFVYVALICWMIALCILFRFITLYQFKLVYYNSCKKHALTSGRIVSLFRHELWRLMVMNKILIVMLVVFLMQLFKLYIYPINITPDEVAYRLTVEEAVKQSNQFEWALQERNLRLAGGKENDIAAINKVIDRLESLPSKGSLLYETGYNELFADNSHANDTTNSFVAILLIIISALYIREWDMRFLIEATSKGRRVIFVNKVLVGLIVSIFVFLIAYLPDFIRISRVYGLPLLNAQAQSLTLFSSVETFTLWGILAYIYFVKFLVIIFICLFVLSFHTSKNIINYSISLFVVFLVPLLLFIIGLRITRYYPVNFFLLSSVLSSHFHGLHFILPLLIIDILVFYIGYYLSGGIRKYSVLRLFSKFEKGGNNA